MTAHLPASPAFFESASWDEIAPYFGALLAAPLTDDTVEDWLARWSRLAELLGEADARGPFADTEDLVSTAQAVFRALDPELGRHFAEMAAEGLLDLGSRPGKAPGGYRKWAMRGETAIGLPSTRCGTSDSCVVTGPALAIDTAWIGAQRGPAAHLRLTT